MLSVHGTAILAFIKLFQEKLNGEFTDKHTELKSRIDVTAASVEEMKNTPKVVVAFRATCAKNFPSGSSTRKSENPGSSFLKSLPQNNVTLMKTKSFIQLFGKISSTISVLLMMSQLENSLLRMMEFIHFMQHQR